MNLIINLKVILLVSLIIRRNKRKKIVTKNNNDPNHLKPVDLDPLETENLPLDLTLLTPIWVTR